MNENLSNCRQEVPTITQPAALPVGQPQRILIADDLVFLAELMQEWLSSHGYSVKVVHDGQAAADYLNQSPVDLVILDVEMPGLDGFEVCAFIRSQKHLAKLPVIISTGRDNPDDRNHAARLDVHAFIPKPFGLTELLAKVRTALQPNLQPLNCTP